MAFEDGNGRSSRQTVAVMFALCCLVQSLTCFSLGELSKKANQDKIASEATVMDVRTGRILFNEKVLHMDSYQADGKGVFEQTLKLENNTADEAAWQRLNPSLHCGTEKMKFRAMGPGTGDLQLDIGNAKQLPLIQVPKTCGYSLKQNSLGLVLVVPYDGCNVIQEDGNYMLQMTWFEIPVKLSCLMSTTSATTLKSHQKLQTLPSTLGPWSLHRHRRQANQPMYDLYSLWYYNSYMNMMRPAQTAAQTTTAKPDTTTAVTTKVPDTTTMKTKPSAVNLPRPVLPAYPYQYYPYYYYPYYYPLPLPPVTTTAPPTTTTGPATTGMTSVMTTTAKMTTTASKTQKPAHPYYPYFPYYPPAGQPLPGHPGIPYHHYYHPLIQHFYGNHPGMPTTKPPTPTTAKPGNPTTTNKPGINTPTSKPSGPDPTTKPTTAPSPSTAQTTKPSNYPGPMSPFVPYYQRPFIPYVLYKSSKAGEYPVDQKLMPQTGYKSGLQPRSPLHPGFNYWQPGPWVPRSTGQDNSPFDWQKFQP